MIALIDADILVYRIGYTTEDVTGNIAVWRMQSKIDEIVENTKATEYKCFLTSDDKSCFRYNIYQQYKANRKSDKPRHYHQLRSNLIKQHKAKVVFNMEADDRLGIEQTSDTIICSIDKDLNQIPGKHYNFITNTLYDVSPLEATQFFYKQMLIGDSADNISGIKGIGPKKAANIIDSLLTEEEMFKAVFDLYKKEYPLSYTERLTQTGQLLKIKQSAEEGVWELPDFEVA